MAVAIPVADEPFNARSFRVYSAEKPGDEFVERPYLHVSTLRRAAAPAIDECELIYQFGSFTTREPDQFGNDQVFPTPPATSLHYTPLADLNRHYVRVEMVEPNESDPETLDVIAKWWGRIELDDRQGLARDPDSLLETGDQKFLAFGMLRELEQQQITTSKVQDQFGNLQTIGRGLAFNRYFGDAFPERGNRTEFEISHGEGGAESDYIFSWAPTQNYLALSGSRGEKWSASQAVEYLLRFQRPTDSDGDEPIEWRIVGDAAAVLDWYDITTETERRTVKSVLDELVRRQRLAGYWVGVDDSGDALVAELHVFSFAESQIDISTGDSIAANADQIELVAEVSRLVTECDLRTMAVHQVDRIIAEGAYVTSTFSILYALDALFKGWEASAESDYNDAATDLERTLDAVRDVFARFIVSDSWPMTIEHDGETFNIVIDYDSIPDTATLDDDAVSDLFNAAGEPEIEQGNWWYRGKRFLRWLEVKLADSNEYRRPFLLFEEPDLPGLWHFAEALSQHSDERKFNVSVGVLTETLGIRATVNRPAGQHLIASEDFDGAVDDATLDPDTAQPVDFRNMEFTGTVEWDERVRVEKEIRETDGVVATVLTIDAGDDVRLAFEVPGTTQDLDENGEREKSAGRVLRDDRDRLTNIVEAAAAWYGVERKPLSLQFETLEPLVELGQLVTKLVIGTSEQEVNTPITGITWAVHQRGVTTRIETSYADADFSRLRR